MTKKPTTLEDVRSMLKKMDRQYGESSLLLFSACVVGTKVKALVEFTKLPLARVKFMVKNCKKNGIFKDGNVHCSWFKKGGYTSFVADSLAAEDLVRRIHVPETA